VNEESGIVRGWGGHRNMVEHFAGKRRTAPIDCRLARVRCSEELAVRARVIRATGAELKVLKKPAS